MADTPRLEAIHTHWSIIIRAHDAGTPESASAARQMLVLHYAKAIRRYVGGIVKKGDDADELAQDVVVRLMKGDFAGADPHRGRFRDLLKTAVRNMVHSHWQKSNRRKTADYDLDLVDAGEEAVDPQWDNAFQQNVLEHAWAVLKTFEQKTPTNPAYSILKLRTELPEATSDELAAKMSLKLGYFVRADAVRQMLRRARLRFAEALIEEVQMGLEDPSPARVTEEFASLGLLEFIRDFLPPDWLTTGKLKE